MWITDARDTVEAKVAGFSELGTGERDYGQGIVRVDHRFLRHPSLERQRIERNHLIRIEDEKGRRVIATIRPSDLDDPSIIAMEYDDRCKLMAEKGQLLRIKISKATTKDMFLYFWNHSNPTIRIDFKLTVYQTISSIILGGLIGLATSIVL